VPCADDREPEPALSAAEAEVSGLFDAYERALVANDVAAMDAVFWDDHRVVRYGIAEVQEGADAIRAWRRAATPVPADRTITSRHVLALSADVVCVDITFANGDAPGTGRQSQVWHRRPEGWRIVRAHVSMI
jgi:ketosteroid isomerase-like protein